MVNYNNIDLEIKRTNGYGQYILTGIVNGEAIKVHTTESEIYDWLYDDSDFEKHEEAKERAYRLIMRAYDNQ